MISLPPSPAAASPPTSVIPDTTPSSGDAAKLSGTQLTVLLAVCGALGLLAGGATMTWCRRHTSGGGASSHGELVEVTIAETGQGPLLWRNPTFEKATPDDAPNDDGRYASMVRQATAEWSKEVEDLGTTSSAQAVGRQEEEPRMLENPAFELEGSSAGSTPEAATAYDRDRAFGAELTHVSSSDPTSEQATVRFMSDNPAFEPNLQQQAREAPRAQTAEEATADGFPDRAYGRLVRRLSETTGARTSSPDTRYDGIVKQITSEWSQEADEPEPQVSSSQAPSSSPSKAPSQSLLQTAEQRALAALAALTNSLGLTDGTVDAVPQQEEEVTSPLESVQPNTASAEPQPSLSTASPSRLWFSFMADPESPPVDPALPADDVREPSAASETSPADVHVQLSGPSPEPEPGGPPRKNYLSSRR
jgi:hypothetical protein